MNNKVLARIVAAVLAVMMLGTFAFAATYTGGTITSTDEDVTEAQTIYTLLAYKADSVNDTEFTDADIIAIEQSTDLAKIKSITVDPAKVGTGFIKVLYGGKEGLTKDATIALPSDAEIEEIEISALGEGFGHGNYVFGEQEFSNVVKVEFTVAGIEGKTITNVGVEFKGEAVEDVIDPATEEVIIAAGTKTGNKVEKEVEVAGGASVTFTAYLFGVPALDAENMVAAPFAQYN